MVKFITGSKNGTLYVGVTNDLVRRIWEHKFETISGFTSRYAVRKLVHYEEHRDIRSAILREKQLKKWNRSWKLQLIEENNPLWADLYDALLASRGVAIAPADSNIMPPGFPPSRE